MAVSKRLRYEILRRDEHTCRYCGGTVPDVVLTIDHVIPQALGGTDEPGNLVAACKDCNAGKSADSPSAALVSDVSADAIRWAKAMEAAAALALEKVGEQRRYLDHIEAEWARLGSSVPRPGDWQRSARYWHAAGVPIGLVLDAIYLSMTNDRVRQAEVWRYACGIIWRRVSEMREDAARILREGEA